MSQLTNRDFWENLSKDKNVTERVRELVTRYRKTVLKTPPALSKKLRSYFVERGTREEFERPYFKKRTITAQAALLALIFPEREEYLACLVKYLNSTLGEISWALPAHCVGVEHERTCVDLFAAETACMLSEICIALEGRLGEELTSRIKAQIKERVFLPYLSNRYAWEDGSSNWTAVCCGNIGIAMMRLESELFEGAKERILHAMARYIACFPDDGNCPEGLHYWNFGFGRFVWFADVLREYSKGENNLFLNEKVKRIAAYAQKMFLKGGASVSISDSDREAKADAALLSFLHGQYPDECVVLPKELMREDFGDIPWLSMSRSFLYGADSGGRQALPQKNYYFESSHLAIVNQKKYSLAVKGGHNGESHNHNDVGSFILATNEGQLLCDLGAGRYFNGYFNPEIRYTLINNASWGHSVPIIGGAVQKEGEEYCGSLSWRGNEISVDFAAAYGGAAQKLVRTFSYQEDRIELTDEFEGCAEITERFVTVVKPKPVERGVKIGNVTLTCEGAAFRISEGEFERHGYKERRLEKVYLIDFDFSEKECAKFIFLLNN